MNRFYLSVALTCRGSKSAGTRSTRAKATVHMNASLKAPVSRIKLTLL